MDAERLKQIEEIYHAVLEIPSDEREAFFNESCGSDKDLRREVESLLTFENTLDNLIDTPPESLAAEMFAEKKSSDIIGKQINHYKILSLLGKGGMGVVYLAEDTKLDRRVAVKFLSAAFVHDADKLNRFRREAKAASALNHPSILTVYEIGENDGSHYIATEFIDGQTLNHNISKEKLGLESVLDISVQIVSALRTAHEAGIVHRDIKPDNLMIRKDGIVKVLDFGLVKLGENRSASRLDPEAATIAKLRTSPGMIMGTPSYMSPEQARGNDITHQTDIFSFGIVLYELLTGKLPFVGESPMDVISAILHKEPIPLNQFLPELPDEIERIVNKTLCKNTDERYQNAKDLLTDLRSVKQRLDYEKVGHIFLPEKSKTNSEREVTKTFDLSASSQMVTAIRAENAAPNNLSGELLPLIGRDAETAEIMNLLRQPETRLLTITGVGGTGKTRLAETVSNLSLAEFTDGVYFIRLAPIDNHEFVAPIIAQTLGVREEAGKSLINCLGDYLREKKLLILLDNFEQITQAAPIIGELLASSPDLKILITSRVRLNLKLECEFTLQPLGIPADEKLTANEFGKYPAVELFVKRAREAKSDFGLTEENAGVIAEICRSLDGLPLAIELAAVRVKLLSPQAILKRLEKSLNLLTGGAKDLPERRQTMRGAIAWSYDLLDREEKKLFNRLSVFRGGLTLEGAEAIGDEEGDSSVDLLDVISSLIDKSLLGQRELANGERRFRMLVVVREFALEKLAESGETNEIKRRHAEFFALLSEEAEPELRSAKAGVWLERLEQELDNLRVALKWSLENQPEIALRIATGVYIFWYSRGYLAEGSKWIMRGLDKTSAETNAKLRVKAYCSIGFLSLYQGDLKAGESFCAESLRIGRQIDDQQLIARALSLLAMAKNLMGDYSAAQILTEESLVIARATDNKTQIALQVNRLGEIARARENYAAARQYYEEACSVAEAESLSASLPIYILNLASIACLLKDYQAAHFYVLKGLDLSEQTADKIIAAGAFDRCGALSVEAGEMENAARLFGASQAIRESTGYKLERTDQIFDDRYISQARAVIGDEAFDAAYASGRQLSLDAAIALAREGKTDLLSDSANEAQITNEAKFDTKSYLSNDALDAQMAAVQPSTTIISDVPRPYDFSSHVQRKKVFLTIAGIILAMAGGFFVYHYLTADEPIKSIAVLPFVNVGDDRDSEYLSDGLSENLINNLSRLSQLKVIARTSSFKFRGENIDIQDAARKLGVAAILTGRVMRRGDDLQISVELIDAADNTRIWGDIYNRKVSGALSVPKEIAQAVSEKLQLKLSGAQEQQMAKQITSNPLAYQFYMNGVFFRRKNGAENIRKAIEYQNQAIALDPSFTRAYTELSISYTVLVEIGALSPKEGMPPARAAAEKALALDETLAEAHYTLARVRDFEFDWTGAERV